MESGERPKSCGTKSGPAACRRRRETSGFTRRRRWSRHSSSTPGTFTGEAAANLIADSVQVEGSRRWTLKNSVRRRVLKQLHTRDALQRALDATPSPSGRLPPACDRSLRDRIDEAAWRADLRGAGRCRCKSWTGWASPTSRNPCRRSTPSVNASSTRRLLDPLRALAGSNFQGRKTELATLASYVERDGAAGSRPCRC